MRLLKIIFKFSDLISHSFSINLMMICLSSNILFESYYGSLKFLLFLSLSLPFLFDFSSPSLDLPLVGLKRVRDLLDVSEVAILSLEEYTTLFGFSSSKTVLALLEHGFQHFLILLIDGFDLGQALIVV